jgi:nucleotide-binding universal stress UspA family protein
MEIKTILVPVDGSPYMRNEIEHACSLSKLFNASVTLLHVVAVPVSTDLGGMPAASVPMEDAGNKILQEAKGLAESFGAIPAVKIEFSVGNPGMRIVKVALDLKADLIIIGAKGQSKLRELLMGSVANTVINNAPCLVLVVRNC